MNEVEKKIRGQTELFTSSPDNVLIKPTEVKTRECRKCGETKPLTEEYFFHDSLNREGFEVRCKTCKNKQDKECWDRRVEEHTRNGVFKGGYKKCSGCGKFMPKTDFTEDVGRADGLSGYCRDCNKNNQLKSRFGITIDEFNHMKATQDNRCPGCMRLLEPKLKPAVDHDHETGEIREVLCLNCNTILGSAHDNIRTLGNLIKYLRKHGKGDENQT